MTLLSRLWCTVLLCLLFNTVISLVVNTDTASTDPSIPRFVVYGDAYDGRTGPPPVAAIKGFNVYILSFLLLEGAWDKAYEWTTLTSAQRSSIKSQYAAAGIKLLVSAFGSTDVPTTVNADPIATANTMAAWVIKYGLDGIDVDYEDINAFYAGDGKAEAWLISFTKQLRIKLPQGKYLLSHAPLAPWFSPKKWPGGGYIKVHAAVGNLIDFYNVQYYNQGASDYTTCTSLLTASSSSTWPQTSVFQLISMGIPASKIVIGKPATKADGSSGFVPTSVMSDCLRQAKKQGWNGGVMAWEYPRANSTWIAAVRQSSWPV
ncbi:glycoside hydrolase [Panaeolus papilionaceus]|nr:glycoside hydrolase [Panaeolus papilionaceus]